MQAGMMLETMGFSNVKNLKEVFKPGGSSLEASLFTVFRLRVNAIVFTVLNAVQQ
jgi:hypothetical protein